MTKEELQAIIAEQVALKVTEVTKSAAVPTPPFQTLEVAPTDQPGSQKLGKGIGFSRFCFAIAAAQGNRFNAGELAKKYWGERDEVALALASSAVSTGGSFVPSVYANEYIELLRAAAVVRKANPLVLSIGDAGNISIPSQTGGATATYGSEGGTTNESSQTTGSLDLTFKELTAITAVSNALLRFSSPNVDQMIRDDLIASSATREDVAFIRGDGTQNTPMGMYWWANKNAATHLLTMTGTTTLATVRQDFGRLRLALRNANSRMIRPTWFMSPRTEECLMAIQNTQGFAVYEAEMSTGKLAGFPYFSTTSIPDTISSTSSELYLCDMADFVIGEATGIEVSAQDGAAYANSAGVVTAGFSKNQTVIKVVSRHDCGMRHAKSVAVLTGVTWAPGTP